MVVSKQFQNSVDKRFFLSYSEPKFARGGGDNIHMKGKQGSLS